MVIAVIPSRYQSTRFPGKALAPIAGLPLVVRVARRVEETALVDRVLVATDDPRIAGAAEGAGIETWISERPFRSGSDRVAAAVADLEVERVLNVQGDEPLVDRGLIAAALEALEDGDLGTVALPLEQPAQLEDHDAVKVALDGCGRALAFARDARALPAGARPYLHVGVYSFRRAALERFTRLPSSGGERSEGLEQLRALENGMSIAVRVVQAAMAAVNRPQDVARVEELLRG